MRQNPPTRKQKMPNPKFEVLNMNPMFTNSILVTSGDECVIFDPWGTVADWEKVLTNNNLKPCAIYATHGHYDHISAAPGLAARYNIPWYMNHRDLHLIDWGNDLLAQMGLPQFPKDYKQPENLIGGLAEVLPGINAVVIETPGHSGGGLAYLFLEQNVLIIGDTLFQETVGRYDLPGANINELKDSIARIGQIKMPDDMVVIHGHGPDSTIAGLKQNNPYFQKISI